MDHKVTYGAPVVLEAPHLDQLFTALRRRGYTIIGPRVREAAIAYEELDNPEELPRGWVDVQEPGSYRLEQGEEDVYFGFTVGPMAWKSYLHQPRMRLWSASREEDNMEIHPEMDLPPRYAFVGVRSCELHAIQIQDRVLANPLYPDPAYQVRREGLFIVAVQCIRPGGTCFCTSMGTGPAVDDGYDLALTEVCSDESHFFLVEAGSEAGAGLRDELTTRAASSGEVQTARDLVEEAAHHMGRQMDTEDIHDVLMDNADHPRWADVASRCLTCGNCTMVCPTCFCTSVEDTSDLSGRYAERIRTWDSCFSLDFSYIHGGHVRSSASSRYRQWMTHKLAAWIDQFGTSGCVGCGRCITWCPVGIDITEEVKAIRLSTAGAAPSE